MTEVKARVLPLHDVSDVVGLRVLVVNAAREITDDDGGISIEIPDTEQLVMAAAVARCLYPTRLKGDELRSIRKIAGWTAADLAARMGERTSPETISRWENEKQPMGGYAEKVFRLVVCEEIWDKTPGMEYNARAIAEMNLVDPWRANPDYEVPATVLELIKVRTPCRKLVDAYEPVDQAT